MWKTMKKKELNPKQQLFVQNYILTANATKSAIDAGYSQRSAYSQASDLLKKPEIRREIKNAQHEILRQVKMKFLVNLDHCISTVVQLTYSNKDNVRLNAATYLLDKITSTYLTEAENSEADNSNEISRYEKMINEANGDANALSKIYEQLIRQPTALKKT